MKKLTCSTVRSIVRSIAILVIVLAALLAMFATVRATPLLVAGTLITVNNTTSNTAPFVALNFNASSQNFSVAHGSLTATNAFWITGQFTLDQTNYVAGGVWYPSLTNATTEYIPATFFTFTPYMRLATTSTNSITYSATYGN